jgi:hypothetical protein
MSEISLIKKTLGKNGRYYFYESLNSVENIKDVYWYRIDESYFNFLIEKYKSSAIKIDKNEEGEIIYMEYKVSGESKTKEAISISEEEIRKNEKGCRLSIILAIITFIIFMLIIFL